MVQPEETLLEKFKQEGEKWFAIGSREIQIAPGACSK